MSKQKIFVVTNVESGWDCVMGVYSADSEESLIEFLGDRYNEEVDVIHERSIRVVKTKSDIREDKLNDLGVK